jgi:tetratricopeptide (TPR) repeat protein
MQFTQARRGLAFVAVAAALAFGATGAKAQGLQQQWVYCVNEGSAHSFDLAVGACTAIIQSGQETQENLVVAFNNRGWAHFKLRDYPRAIADYDQSLQINPQYSTALHNRGSAYHMQGDYPRAITDYDAAIRLDPGNANLRYDHGLAHHEQSNYPLAIASYSEAVRLNPNDAEAFHRRGRAHYQQSEHQLAISDLTEALRLNPQLAEAYDQRGEVYTYGLRDYERAAVDYDRAVELAPDVQEFRNDACWLRAAYLNREYDRARADCDVAVQLSNNAANTHDSRGLVGLKQERFQDAWNDYDAAARAVPASAHYLFGRGVAALRLGRSVEGQADIAAALALDANIAQSYAGYGVSP